MKDVLKDLTRRTRMMLARVVLSAVNDAAGIQVVQVRLMQDEAKGDVPHLQTYGLSSHPHPGAEAIALFMGGNRDHAVVLGIDDRRYRVRNLQQGEVILYTDEDQKADGHRLHFKRGQEVEILAGKKFVVKVGENVRLEMTPEGVKIFTPDLEVVQS